MKVEYVTCLDSLFTMPKARLTEFCNYIIQSGLKVKWICYARADDLCDEKVVEIMVKAGCIHAQIGIESGDQTILNNMSKRVEVEKNLQAIRNCEIRSYQRRDSHRGFSGRNRRNDSPHLRIHERGATGLLFSCGLELACSGVYILSAENRGRHGIEVLDNPFQFRRIGNTERWIARAPRTWQKN